MNRKAPLFWVSFAALLTLMYWIVKLHDPFSFEPHAWASAHLATIARSFAQLGIIHLHGIPVQNNLPLGLQPDRYLHWPPLNGILLGMAFRIFGESEAVVHSFTIVVNICFIVAFYFLVKRCFDRQTAIFSVFALLTLPVFIQYGRLAWTPNAPLAAICAALYCFVRGTETSLNWKWIFAGVAAVVLGVLLSWEVAPLGLILLGFAIWQRSKARQVAAATYAAASLCTVVIVLGYYVYYSPELQGSLWATVRYRMGAPYHPTDIPIHAWTDHVNYSTHITLSIWLTNMRNGWGMLLGGAMSLVATAGLIRWSWTNRKSRPDVFFVVGALLGTMILWIALFPNFVFIHDYESLFLVPLVAVSLGVALKLGAEWPDGQFRWLATLLVPLILILPLIHQSAQGFKKMQQDPAVEYAKDIERNTLASAVVFSSSDSMVPVYYSRRHIIRSVSDDEALRALARKTQEAFPGSDIYLAIPPDSLAQFACASSRFTLIKRTQNMVLFKVVAGVCG